MDHPSWTPEKGSLLEAGMKAEKEAKSGAAWEEASAEGNAGGSRTHAQKLQEDFFGAYMTIDMSSVHYGNKVGKAGGASKRRTTRRIIRPPAWKDSGLSYPALVEAVREKILPQLDEKRRWVRVFARTIRAGTEFHANPCHGRHKLAKQHWVECVLEQGSTFPCHLLCIVEVPVAPNKEGIELDDDT